jgi:uncharacterized protein YeaO (DUF488 family)
MGTDIRIRRIYDDPAPSDGAPVLVDRIWPRGLVAPAPEAEPAGS